MLNLYWEIIDPVVVEHNHIYSNNTIVLKLINCWVKNCWCTYPKIWEFYLWGTKQIWYVVFISLKQVQKQPTPNEIQMKYLNFAVRCHLIKSSDARLSWSKLYSNLAFCAFFSFCKSNHIPLVPHKHCYNEVDYSVQGYKVKYSVKYQVYNNNVFALTRPSLQKEL